MKKLLTIFSICLALVLPVHLVAQQAYVFFTKGFRATPQRFDLSDPSSARIIGGSLDQASFVLSMASLNQGEAYAYTGVSFFNMTMPAAFSKISFSKDSILDNILLAYNEMDYLYYDMAYDNSTSSLYAIANSRSDNSAWGKDLLKVNLEEGDDFGGFERIGNFSEDLCALAIDYAGNMYGVGSSGAFYLVDKESAALTLIGNTGLDVSRDYQSMEFDHGSGQLYWTANTKGEENALYRIDLLTGKATKVGAFSTTSDFVNGLCIPFQPQPTVPGAVSDFFFRQNANQRELRWTCPELDFSGNKLTGTMQVEIFRDGVSIFTKDGIQPGAQMVEFFIDEPYGLHIYRIVAKNESGEGPGMLYRVMVGNDVPAQATDVVFTSFEDSVCLSWKPVSTGKFGGYIDAATLAYRLTRYPDSVVYEVGADTSFVDRSIPKLDNYYYDLLAYTKDGEGVPFRVGPVMAGEPYQDYFACGFNTSADFNPFTVIDADGDFRTWEYSEFMKQEGAFYRAGTATNDDYLVLPPVRLKAGQEYNLRYDVGTPYYDFTEQLQVCIGTQPTAESLSKVISTKKYTLDPKGEDELSFKVDQDGVYYIAFRAMRDEYSSGLFLSNIILQPTGKYTDLSCEVVRGPEFLRSGVENEVEVYLKNRGKMSVSSAKVALIDHQGNVLMEPSGAGSLSAGRGSWVKFNFVPKNTGNADIRAVVSLSGDEQSINDTSLVWNVDVMPSCIDVMPMVNGGIRQNGVPVHLGSSSSASQFIVSAQELGFFPGSVTQISFDYENMNGADEERPMAIYLANVEEDNLTGGWIEEDRFTKVYDAPVYFNRTRNVVDIEFSTPFTYTGKNICVMVIAEPYNQFFGAMHYWLSNPSKNVCRYWFYQNGDASSSFDFSQPGSLADFTPDISLKIDACNGGVISGKVLKSEDMTPVPGAKVSVKSSGLETTTSTDGSWTFPYVSFSTDPLRLSVEAYSYKDTVLSFVFEKDTVLEVKLENRARYNVKGSVEDVLGNPVGGAQVRISGYDTYTALTDATGAFYLKDCYQYDNYLLEAFGSGKELYEREGLVVDRPDSDAGKVVLKDKAFAPRNVKATENADILTVSWEETDSLETFRYDNGNVYLAYGDEEGTEKTVLGAVFRNPARLTSMSWMTVPYYGKLHHKVNVFVFALDKDGMPTSTLLYSKMDVPNVDSVWTSHTFEKEVVAPDGFMLALSYKQGSDGYLSIANDYQDPQAVGGYRFVPNTQYYSSDYTTGKFETVESMGFSSSMFIRAQGEITGLFGFEVAGDDKGGDVAGLTVSQDVSDNVAKSLDSYKVWRIPYAGLQDPSAWDLVSQVSADKLSCQDEDWSGLEQGLYYYAVQSVYSGNSESEAVRSDVVMKDMLSDVTFKATANSGESTEGLQIVISHLEYTEYVYRLTIGDGGSVGAEILKGSYMLVANGLPAFEEYTSIIDVLDDKEEIVLDIEENICDPVIDDISQKAENSCEMKWSNPCAAQKLPVRYVLFLDGDSVGETTSMNFIFTQLSLGMHQFGVQAIYHTGKSVIKMTSYEIKPLSNQEMENAGLIFYPNPASDVVWLDGPFLKIELLDIYGRVCLEVHPGHDSINVESLPEGIYLIRWYRNDGSMSVGKLIIK